MTNTVGPGAPYITPDVLKSANTGINWDTVPDLKSTADQKNAAVYDMCQRATDMVDGYCNTPLRATIDTETFFGPDEYNFTLANDGIVRLVASRPPVVSIISGQYSSTAAFPEVWTPLAANQFKVEQPLLGVYGTTTPSASGGGGAGILMAPHVVWGTRGACQVQVTYLNGWPHTQITQAAAIGDTVLHVDDCTGWTGAFGRVKDAIEAETVTVTSASAQSGPGTLTLSAPLTFAHAAGVLVTTLPGTVEQAAILLAVDQALVKGQSAMDARLQPGRGNVKVKTAMAEGITPNQQRAYAMLTKFRRVV